MRLRILLASIAVLIGLLAFGTGPAMAGSAKLVKYRAADDDPTKDNVKFFDHGGLQLFGDCSPIGGGNSDMSIVAKSTAANSSIHVIIKAPTDDVSTTRTDTFGNPGGGELIGIGSSQFDHDASGMIIYARPGGVNVSVKFAAIEDLGFESTKDCAFFGVARVLDGTSSSRVNFRSDANGSGGFTMSGANFDASCSSSSLGVFGNTTVSSGVIGYDNRVTFTDGFFVVADYGSEDTVSPVPSDDGIGQIVFAAPSGGPNLTIDYLSGDASDAAGDGTPFGGTKQCAWVGTARSRSSGDAKRVNFRAAEGTGLTPFFGNGGLILEGSCAGPNSAMTIQARSTKDNAVITANRALTAGYEHNSDPNFDASVDSYDLLGQLGVGTNDATGQLVYSKPDGTVTTIDWMAIQGNDPKPFGGAKDCAFVGTAEKKLP